MKVDIVRLDRERAIVIGLALSSVALCVWRDLRFQQVLARVCEHRDTTGGGIDLLCGTVHPPYDFELLPLLVVNALFIGMRSTLGNLLSGLALARLALRYVTWGQDLTEVWSSDAYSRELLYFMTPKWQDGPILAMWVGLAAWRLNEVRKTLWNWVGHARRLTARWSRRSAPPPN